MTTRIGDMFMLLGMVALYSLTEHWINRSILSDQCHTGNVGFCTVTAAGYVLGWF